MKRISNINIRSIFKKDSKQRKDLEIRNEQSCSVNVTKLHTFAYTLKVPPHILLKTSVNKHNKLYINTTC